VATRGRGMLIQPDGMIVVTGIQAVNQGQVVVVRLTPLGAGDAGFGSSGIVSFGITGGSGGMAVGIETSGRLLVGGFGATDFDGNSSIAVAALLPDGNLDATFGAGGSVTSSPGSGWGTARAVLPGPSGVVAPSEFHNVVNTPSEVFYGYDTDGAQTAFKNTADHVIQVGTRQPDGKILIGGRDGANEFYVTRFLEDATADTTFNFNGTTFVSFESRRSIATGLSVFPGGQILVGGVSEDLGGNDPRVAFAKLNANGTPDGSFGVAGKVLSTAPLRTLAAGSIVLDSQGRIVFGGAVGDGTRQPAIARFLPDGSPDTSFGPNGTGVVVLDQIPADPNIGVGVWGIAVDDHDRIVVSGELGPDSGPSLFVARYWF
jgi:uncharacterized delta-60 repeat protein